MLVDQIDNTKGTAIVLASSVLKSIQRNEKKRSLNSCVTLILTCFIQLVELKAHKNLTFIYRGEGCLGLRSADRPMQPNRCSRDCF